MYFSNFDAKFYCAAIFISQASCRSKRSAPQSAAWSDIKFRKTSPIYAIYTGTEIGGETVTRQLLQLLWTNIIGWWPPRRSACRQANIPGDLVQKRTSLRRRWRVIIWCCHSVWVATIVHLNALLMMPQQQLPFGPSWAGGVKTLRRERFAMEL